MLIIMALDVYTTLKWDSNSASMFLPMAAIYLVQHNMTYREMKKIGEGRELNKILGKTALNIFVFGIFSVFIILGILLQH